MRAFVLAGALLLGVAVLPSAADAALLPIKSDGVGETCSGTNQAAGCTSTVITTPNSAWKASVGGGAQWVSWGQTGQNPATTDNGTTMTIKETFDGGGEFLSIKALADDYANIKIYQTSNAANVIYSFTSNTPGNSTCNSAVIGCIDANQLNATSALIANLGTNYTFEITIFQTNAVSFGVNYLVTNVPLPAAVLLFGSALAGLGVMRRRKSGAAVAA